MPTTVATPNDIAKLQNRATLLEEQFAKLRDHVEEMKQQMQVLTGGTATEEVGD